MSSTTQNTNTQRDAYPQKANPSPAQQQQVGGAGAPSRAHNPQEYEARTKPVHDEVRGHLPFF